MVLIFSRTSCIREKWRAVLTLTQRSDNKRSRDLPASLFSHLRFEIGIKKEHVVVQDILALGLLAQNAHLKGKCGMGSLTKGR